MNITYTPRFLKLEKAGLKLVFTISIKGLTLPGISNQLIELDPTEQLEIICRGQYDVEP